MNRRAGVVAVVAGLLAAGGAVTASAGTNDGVSLRAQFPTGGTAQLELEGRNVEPLICFVYDTSGPHDGESIRSSIHDASTGAEVLELGFADQWVDGATEGCRIPLSADTARAIFSRPQGYVVQLDVVEHQGPPGRPGPYVSSTLQPG